MEQFPITKIDQGFHIEGFPDAIKVFKLGGPLAKRLADFALHKADLEFALACLESINTAPSYPSPVRQALWHSAVVHFFKCFKYSKSRGNLEEEKVYEGDSEGLEIFKHLESLRDRHIVHDENSYAQCLPGVVLNKRDAKPKIAKIICLNAIAETLDQSNYSNLYLLCTRAKAWVIKQFDELCDGLTIELEGKPYEDLEGREGIAYTPPKLEDIGVTRKSP